MANLSKTAAIVGVAESDEIGDVPNKSALQHHAEAAYNALEDAGLSIKDVDGLLTAGFSTLTTAEYFGYTPRSPTPRPSAARLSWCTSPTP